MIQNGKSLALVTVAVAVIGACALVYILLELFIDCYNYPGGPRVNYPTPANALEAREQDLAYFRHYLALDRSYSVESRRAALRLLQVLQPNLASLSDAAFQLGIARAVAAADNGHSNVWFGRFSRQHGRLPLRFYWFSDGPVVVRAREDLGELLGARLLAIGDTPLDQASAALQQFVGGSIEGFRAYRGAVLLELPAAHAAADLGDSETQTRLTLLLADGRLVTRVIDAETLAGDWPLFWSQSYLFARPPELEPDPWTGLAARIGDLPLYLREPARQFRVADLPGNGLYLQYRDNFSDGIEAFNQGVRQRIAARPPDYLVVDQRMNGGGDYTLTAGLMADLPGLVGAESPVYVLTGNSTFSAGINSVAFLEAAAPERVTIVGERIGDRERAYGETNDFELPNSRMGMTFSTGLHDLANGCPPVPQCYYLNYFFDVAVGRLDPDIAVPTTVADYLAGRDPVLEAVLADRALSVRAQ